MLKRLARLLRGDAPPALSTEDDALLFGAKVRQARDRAGLNQAHAAKAVGMTARKLSLIENGDIGLVAAHRQVLDDIAALPAQMRLPEAET